MVEINISLKIKEDTELQKVLEHIMKEIIDEKYREDEILRGRKSDSKWVYLDEGRYNWSRDDR